MESSLYITGTPEPPPCHSGELALQVLGPTACPAVTIEPTADYIRAVLGS